MDERPYALIQGDCLEVMRSLPENSVDSIVTDPPYELGFMGKNWDSSGIAYNVDMWREALRVLKPGGHMLAFSGSRTYHRMTVAIEDAGFEIRDQIMWVYGSGFPKSLNVAKAIASGGGRPEDIRRMQMGAEYEPSGRGRVNYDHGTPSAMNGSAGAWQPQTVAARQWQGWGTALKPAHEPICVARKPLVGTVAENVLQFGTGAINIERCRVATNGEQPKGSGDRDSYRALEGRTDLLPTHTGNMTPETGRWPANFIHDGSAEVVALFPTEAGGGSATQRHARREDSGWDRPCNLKHDAVKQAYEGKGSAARFFYCAKASRKDRNDGTESLPQKVGGMVSNTSGQHITRRDEGYEAKPQGNHHPTVKPTDLMAYLVRLVTPPGGLVLDPFMGSGSTGKACMREGFRFVGIDLTTEYSAIAEARISHELAKAETAAEEAAKPGRQPDLFDEEAA
jgi:site-specific DNA-methyltransferase (adenine-specific)